jgi:teichuronic acid biosynthesis glycosyltransferase TuaC
VTKPPHLLVYSSQFPTPGDPNGGVFTLQLARALGRSVEVSVVCPIPWRPAVGWLSRGVSARWYAGVPRTMWHGDLFVHYPRYWHLPWVSGPLQPTLQVLAAAAAVRRIDRARAIDCINGHFVFPDGVAATRLARRLAVPVFLTALGSDINVYAQQRLRRPQIVRALRRADAVSAVSRALAERIVDLGTERKKVHWIPNGVDADRFFRVRGRPASALRHEMGLADRDKVLVFVGRLHSVKGLNHLLEALHALRSTGRLGFATILVGDGDRRSELEGYVRTHSLSDVVCLPGEVPHHDVPRWLQAADVFCLPSLMEGMPNVILEAQACGLPVVATRVGGIPDMVAAGAGILVEPGRPDALAEALDTAMHIDWDRDWIARAAQLQSWDAVAAKYLAVVESIRSGRHSRPSAMA